jgi:hypothetical protein
MNFVNKFTIVGGGRKDEKSVSQGLGEGRDLRAAGEHPLLVSADQTNPSNPN